MLWTTTKESPFAFAVYADFIKDAIYCLIIVQALGGIGELTGQYSIGWTFSVVVSTGI